LKTKSLLLFHSLSETAHDVPRALGGNLILRPMYHAAQTSIATAELQRGARGRLRYVAETMGIRQASRLYAGFAKEVQLVDSVPGVGMEEGCAKYGTWLYGGSKAREEAIG
jgi:hypothetical protein